MYVILKNGSVHHSKMSKHSIHHQQHAGLTNGSNYGFRVAAVYASSQSPYSDIAYATPSAPWFSRPNFASGSN